MFLDRLFRRNREYVPNRIAIIRRQLLNTVPYDVNIGAPSAEIDNDIVRN